MRRRTPDHRTERHDGIAAPGRRDAPHDERQVERAGDPYQLDLLLAGAVAQQRVDCAADQGIHDRVVEPRGDDREAQVAREQVALERADVVHAIPPELLQSTYSATSRSKAERPCICFGALSTRMRVTPRSRRIWAPMP